MINKKNLILPLAVMIMMLMIGFVTSTGFFAAETGFKRGDANNDGFVSISDATTIQRKLAEFSTDINLKAADVDGNGLDIADATNIQRYLAEFDDPYHIGEFVSDNTEPTRDEYELPFIPN